MEGGKEGRKREAYFLEQLGKGAAESECSNGEIIHSQAGGVNYA